jgi:site-specific DNA-methyltransferase (adenine-specific)
VTLPPANPLPPEVRTRFVPAVLLIAQLSCLPFLSVLGNKSIDLWLFDPPYNISRKTGFKFGKNPAYDRLKVSKDFGDWDKVPFPLEESLAEAYRTLRPRGTAIVWYDFWKIETLKALMERAGFAQFRLIEWVKTNPVPHNTTVNYLTNAREFAVLGVRGGKSTFHGKYDNGIYSMPIPRVKKGEKRHPTMKPLGLMEQLVAKHSNPGDVVGDFCMGSGTTGVAALKLGRQFVGCEPYEDYFASADARIMEGEEFRNANSGQNHRGLCQVSGQDAYDSGPGRGVECA